MSELSQKDMANSVARAMSFASKMVYRARVPYFTDETEAEAIRSLRVLHDYVHLMQEQILGPDYTPIPPRTVPGGN